MNTRASDYTSNGTKQKPAGITNYLSRVERDALGDAVETGDGALPPQKLAPLFGPLVVHLGLALVRHGRPVTRERFRRVVEVVLLRKAPRQPRALPRSAGRSRRAVPDTADAGRGLPIPVAIAAKAGAGGALRRRRGGLQGATAEHVVTATVSGHAGEERGAGGGVGRGGGGGRGRGRGGRGGEEVLVLAGLLPGGGRGLTPGSGPGRRSGSLTMAVLGLRVLPGRVEERVFPLGRVGGGGRRRRGAGLGVEDERVPLRHGVQARGRSEERGGGRGATATASAAGRGGCGGLDDVASTLHPLEELLQLPLLLHALHSQQLELTWVDGHARGRLPLSGHHFRQHALDLVQAVQRVELGQLREALELLVRVGKVEGGVRQSRVVEEVEVGEVHLRLIRSWNTCMARKKTVRDIIVEVRKPLTHRLYTVISLFYTCLYTTPSLCPTYFTFYCL